MNVRQYILEKTLDTSVNKRWWDIFNLQLAKKREKIVYDIVRKHIRKFRHPLIDPKRTQIEVVPSIWAGSMQTISIKMYDKKGTNIFQQDDLSYGEASFGVAKTKGKWVNTGGRLYLKPEFQGTGVGTKINQLMIKVFKNLDLSTLDYETSDMGRYVWAQLPKARFRDSKEEAKVRKAFGKWASIYNYNYKSKLKLKQYPKNFLISTYAPEFIWYTLPV